MNLSRSYWKILLSLPLKNIVFYRLVNQGITSYLQPLTEANKYKLCCMHCVLQLEISIIQKYNIYNSHVPKDSKAV